MKKVKAKDLDKKFDNGKEDILDHFDLDNPVKRVNVDFPVAVLKDLDELAKKRGVTRQSLLKIWVFEKIQQENAS